MKWRRLKVIADPRHPALVRVVDVESGDQIYGITAVQWGANVAEDFPTVTLSFAADMIDFEVTRATEKE